MLKEKAETESKLATLQAELLATTKLIETHETGIPSSAQQSVAHKTGTPSSEQLDQQVGSPDCLEKRQKEKDLKARAVVEKQSSLNKDLAQFPLPPKNVVNIAREAEEQKKEAEGESAKANSEPPADKIGTIQPSAEVTEVSAQGKASEAVGVTSAGKDLNPQPAEVDKSSLSEMFAAKTAVSNAAPEQEAGTAENNAGVENDTGRVEQDAASVGEIHAVPLRSAASTILGEGGTAQVRGMRSFWSTIAMINQRNIPSSL